MTEAAGDCGGGGGGLEEEEEGVVWHSRDRSSTLRSSFDEDDPVWAEFSDASTDNCEVRFVVDDDDVIVGVGGGVGSTKALVMEEKAVSAPGLTGGDREEVEEDPRIMAF